VKRLALRAGTTTRISPHGLRHSFITAALDAGVALRYVQEAASHADPPATLRYDRARQPSTGTPATSSPPSSPALPADHPSTPGDTEHRYRPVAPALRCSRDPAT
jgi:hypothetical protein